mgnify:CR=1 FL=1
MRTLVIGDIVSNSRTGATGKIIEQTERWTGRHYTKQVVVDCQGDIKRWCYSSLKIVEDEQPRSLRIIRDILKDGLRNLEDYDIELNVVVTETDLQNAENYRKLDYLEFSHLALIARVKAPEILNELIDIYFNKKVDK